MTLLMTVVDDGRVLDTVDLGPDGVLAFRTGVAFDLADMLRHLNPGLTDEEVYDLLTDWSNGYVSMAEVPDAPQPVTLTIAGKSLTFTSSPNVELCKETGKPGVCKGTKRSPRYSGRRSKGIGSGGSGASVPKVKLPKPKLKPNQ